MSRSDTFAKIPLVDAVLAYWLTIGALALALIPPAQWHGAWIGWLPFWAVLVPAMALAQRCLPRLGTRARKRLHCTAPVPAFILPHRHDHHAPGSAPAHHRT
ncbi:MAG: hypothetical protein AB7D30_11140, partial [Lysobacteraceae bacterium]